MLTEHFIPLVYLTFLFGQILSEPSSAFHYKLAASQEVCIGDKEKQGQVITFVMSKIYPPEAKISFFYQASGYKTLVKSAPKVDEEIFTYISESGLIQFCIANQSESLATISLKSYQGIFTLKDHRQINEAELGRTLDDFLKSVKEISASLSYASEKIEADSSAKSFYSKLKDALLS